ncbi:MAG: DUF5812 family protein [Natrialbaceae archaeon]|nr:DUF5812 family protein [Natrialbaceae archaeon]
MRGVAGELDSGGMQTIERAGEGTIDVLPVESERVETAVEDVASDPETIARAARQAAERVEIRSSSSDGIVSVRFLPE